jgi:hypothetical protein
MHASDPLGAHIPAPGDSTAALGEALYEFPTTIAQQAFWYLDQVERGNPAWNIAVRFRIQGPLRVDLLEQAMLRIVERHEILRTTFSITDGEVMQVVHEQAHIPLPIDDLSHLEGQLRDKEEERLTITEGARPFSLKHGPLLRARLLRFAANDHMLLVTIHHIISDGWSIGILSDEIGAHYQALAGDAPELDPLPLQFADYVIWKNERTSEAQLAPHRAYWQTKLAELPLCEIRPDQPRPRVKTHNGYILSTVLPVPLTRALTEYAHQQGSTLSTLALSALKLLIRHYTRQDDIFVGTLVAGREQVELEPLVGIFINTLVLRTRLDGEPTFAELMARVQQTVEEAMAHQDLHFQQLVELLRPKRDLSRPTLYSINFIYQRDFVKPLQFSSLTMTPVPSKSPGAIYDLNFFMVERADGWRLSCEYNTDLYSAASVNRMIGQLRSLLEQIAANPERRLSEFAIPADAGDPLPAFAPGNALAGGSADRSGSAPSKSASASLENGRSRSGAAALRP